MQRLMNATLAVIVLATVACVGSRTPQASASTQKCADVMAPGTSCSVR